MKPNAHLTRDSDFLVMLVASRTAIWIAVVENQSDRRFLDTRLALFVDNFLQVVDANLQVERKNSGQDTALSTNCTEQTKARCSHLRLRRDLLIQLFSGRSIAMSSRMKQKT